MRHLTRLLIAFFAALTLLAGCAQPAREDIPANSPWLIGETPAAQVAAAIPAGTPQFVPTRAPDAPIVSPTPDPPREIPTPRLETDQYTVQRGDSLGEIARRYNISVRDLIDANTIPNPDVIEVGTVLTIPAPQPRASGPGAKLIPDSELVNGPGAVGFDIRAFVERYDSYLLRYEDDVEGTPTGGPEIIERVATDYSVNPRLLLAVLEYRAGWVTQANPDATTRDFPIGYFDDRRAGLYRQLAWAANELNRGYYMWRSGGLYNYTLLDNSLVPVDATINAGTAGVQWFFSLLLNYSEWQAALGDQGFIATYQRLFGYPFDFAFEPLIPNGLQQPEMRLPIEDGTLWSFTGGPHGGWADGSAWAALDFAPPGDPAGCVQKDDWVVASASGRVVRTGNGAVIQDLDGDGHEQTGWVIFYMHIESRDRVRVGDDLQPGDRVGHPSCEGGFSNGTHLHLARKYNGEWIPADSGLPFNLDGWISSGDGREYDGFLTRDDHIIEAVDGRTEANQVER